MDEALRSWCSDKLSQLMGNCFLPDGDLVTYILSIPTSRDLEEFLREIFGDAKKQICLEFIAELKKEKARINSKMKCLPTSEKKQTLNLPVSEKKTSAPASNDDVVLPKEDPFVTPGFDPMFVNDNVTPFRKKQLKYVPLQHGDGQSDSLLLPGRHACECLSQKHRLINNCTQCGRIVCEQEGSGPCFFCGNLVCSPEEQEILVRNSKKSSKLMQKLMQSLPADENEITESNSVSEKEKNAKAHKEKLLEYDRTSARRTKVIDDEADYFSSSKWLSAESRKKLKDREDELLNKKYSSRRDRKIKIDLAGRTVRESHEDMNIYNPDDEVVRSVELANINPGNDTMNISSVDPRIKVPRPQFVADENDKAAVQIQRGVANDVVAQQTIRVQDKEFLEMQDDGMCLSMHQPWASLLVNGVKTVEGRGWYSSHRGRLWIAAAAKVPTADDIKGIEAQYTALGRVDFPNDYPTGVLLGCVDVLDCLKNEEFCQKYPNCREESSSSYVFICRNPRELLVKIPMKGQHKIWKLDSTVHNMVRRSLVAAA